MNLAVLSDIHGNVRALNAVIHDLECRGIEQVVNLGDCLYGPFDPRPVADCLMAQQWPTVAGNEDRVLVEAARGVSHSRTATFVAKLLDRSHIEWLATVPPTLNVHGAFLFHGSPDDDEQYLLTVVEESGARPRGRSEVGQFLVKHSHALILCGHDHTPRVLKLDNGQMIVNPGSVGCPAYSDGAPHEHTIENGSPHARYAIVEIRDGDVIAELVSVTYNWDAAAQEARSNEFPDWSVWIQTGSVT